MISTLIFDLDGVLVDTKMLHFKSLNKALSKHRSNLRITLSDHIQIYDGLSTHEKLKILNKKKELDSKFNVKIKKLKQSFTKEFLIKEIKFNKQLFNLFKIYSQKYKICVATNAVRETLELCIKKLKINDFIDYKISNEDVDNPKPHPEIYLRCMTATGSRPSECIIIEDSHIGRVAAQESGGRLLPVKKLSDVNLQTINTYINDVGEEKKVKTSWKDKSLNVLIPMAGAGSRFEKAGYTFPKPLVEIDNKPMIQWVIESLDIDANYIFLVQKEHQRKFNISSMLKILISSCKIIYIDKLTEGAACTTLLAKKYINNNSPLIISNSDQFLEWNSSRTMYNFNSKSIDGGILCFNSSHPKWSYALTDKNNYVIKVAEKKVISKNATVGLYYWRKGKDYVKYAEQMIKKNIRINNEFYVCPVYNEAIKAKKKIIIDKVDKMWGLGTPEDLDFFVKNKLSKK